MKPAASSSDMVALLMISRDGRMVGPDGQSDRTSQELALEPEQGRTDPSNEMVGEDQKP